MPRIVLMLPDTNESFTRPVVYGIIKELFKVTGIDDKTRVVYPGDFGAVAQAGSQMGAEGDDPYTTGSRRLSVRVDEDFVSSNILADAVLQPQNLFVWKDEALAAYVKPAYAKTEFTLNFEFRAKDRTEAMRWRDEMKTRISMMRDQYLHSAKYHFMIPEVALSILQEIHRLRENVAPYGQQWDQYFTDHASSRVSKISTLSGEREAWAVSETQARIIGQFNFEGAPEKGENNADGGTWNISFQYKFEIDKPLACVMVYPLVVHNQVLPGKFRPAKEDLAKRPEDFALSRSLSSAGYAAFEAGRWSSDQRNVTAPGKTVPEYDEFLPNGVPNRTLRLFTALTTLDPQDPRYLLRLDQVSSKWHLDSGVLEYMRKISERLNVPGGCPLQVSLYENLNLLSGHNVRVSSDLKVYATRDLDLRKVYHVRLGLVTDWSSVRRDALDLLREDANTLLKLLTAIDSRSSLSQVLGNYVPRAALESAIDFLNRAELAQGNGQIYQYNLVEQLLIVAARKE